jgi:hypothetical protein
MPALTERLGGLTALIKAMIGVLALLPGVAVLTGLIDIPPSLVELVKALSVFTGIGVLIAILLLSESIRRMSARKVALLTVAAVLLGAGFALAYRTVAAGQVVIVTMGDQVERYVIPLAPSDEIGRLVAPYGGDYAEALMTSVRAERLRQLMEEDSGSAVALMVLLMVLAQTLMVGGLVVGGWKLTMADRATAAKPSPARASAPRGKRGAS